MLHCADFWHKWHPIVVVVHGHFWTSGCSGSILQPFGFKLLVRASRVAKIL